MYLRLFIGILLVVLITYLGYLFSTKYYNKYHFFKDMYIFNNSFIENIKFKRETIVEYTSKREDKFSLFFINYKKNRDLTCLSNLNIDDKNFITEYINVIGKSNYNTELEKLSVYSNKIKYKQELYYKEYLAKKNLYTKLGFFIGLILMILII